MTAQNVTSLNLVFFHKLHFKIGEWTCLVINCIYYSQHLKHSIRMHTTHFITLRGKVSGGVCILYPLPDARLDTISLSSIPSIPYLPGGTWDQRYNSPKRTWDQIPERDHTSCEQTHSCENISFSQLSW